MEQFEVSPGNTFPCFLNVCWAADEGGAEMNVFFPLYSLGN